MLSTGLAAIVFLLALITFFEDEVANANSHDHNNQPRHHYEHHKYHQHHNYFENDAFYPLTDAGVGD